MAVLAFREHGTPCEEKIPPSNRFRFLPSFFRNTFSMVLTTGFGIFQILRVVRIILFEIFKKKISSTWKTAYHRRKNDWNMGHGDTSVCWAHMSFVVIFSSAWLCQQSYCHGAGVRRPYTQVSQKPLHGSRPNFVGSSLSTISPDHFFFLFSKFSIFKFLRIVFRFR